VSLETITVLAPEIVLVAVAAVIYLAGAFVRARNAWSAVAACGVTVAAVFLALGTSAVGPSGPLEMDALAHYTRWLALGMGALLVLLAARPLATGGTSEYLGSLLLVVAGMMLVAGTRELVLLFVGLELVSIPTYILLYLGRRGEGSQEATAKYFFLSILASAVFLYGLSFLYGATGSTDLRVIHERLIGARVEPGELGSLVVVALVMIYAGLGFRITAVPFHFYAPDVYEGTTHENAGLLSVAPKIAGMIALVRIVALGLAPVEAYPWRIAMILAIVTMTLGNVVALWQNNLRRLLAYSSIAHAGYMLIGLAAFMATQPGAAGSWDGLGALLLYLLVYALATIGAFAVLACLGRGEKPIEAVEELAGLGWTGGWLRPSLAVLLALFMFSLTGIPPLAGFWGKLSVFASALSVGGSEQAVRNWFIALAVIGVLNAAVSAGYYLRIVGVMFFRLPLATPRIQPNSAGPLFAAVLCGLMTLLIGLAPKLWMEDANHASPGRHWAVTNPSDMESPQHLSALASSAVSREP
jgi:NADH-quinone oxidoreductase subunit N